MENFPEYEQFTVDIFKTKQKQYLSKVILPHQWITP